MKAGAGVGDDPRVAMPGLGAAGEQGEQEGQGEPGPAGHARRSAGPGPGSDLAASVLVLVSPVRVSVFVPSPAVLA